MGNQQIKDSLKKVQDKDFDDNLLSPHLDKLWSFDNDRGLNPNEIGDNIFTCEHPHPDNRFNQHFPTQCYVESIQGNDYTTSKVLRDQIQAAGFATSERSIDQLRQEGKYSFLKRVRSQVWECLITVTYRGQQYRTFLIEDIIILTLIVSLLDFN